MSKTPVRAAGNFGFWERERRGAGGGKRSAGGAGMPDSRAGAGGAAVPGNRGKRSRAARSRQRRRGLRIIERTPRRRFGGSGIRRGIREISGTGGAWCGLRNYEGRASRKLAKPAGRECLGMVFAGLALRKRAFSYGEYRSRRFARRSCRCLAPLGEIENRRAPVMIEEGSPSESGVREI